MARAEIRRLHPSGHRAAEASTAVGTRTGGPVMRFLVEVGPYRLDIDFTRDDGEEPDDPALEPQPQGATSGVLERSAAWDHDTRTPVGFQRWS